MISYEDTDSGFRIRAFRPGTREELEEIKIWCRKNIGRSHGPGPRTWWIRRVRPAKLSKIIHVEVAMTQGPYMFLAQLTWA